MNARKLIMPHIAEIRAAVSYDPLTGIFRWRRKDGKGKHLEGEIAGSLDKDGYRLITIGYERFAAHRLAWATFYEAEPPDYLDHRNLQHDDNSIVNLREATNQQNMGNGRKKRNNTSGFKGVYFYKKYAVWCACIRVNGKTRYLGQHPTPELAAAAYCAAANEAFGDFARAA